MFIEIAQAGVLSEAPSIYELLVRATQTILNFVGALAVLAIVGSGIVYMASSGNMDQHRFAKTILTGSVIGLAVVLVSLIIVSSLVKVFGW